MNLSRAKREAEGNLWVKVSKTADLDTFQHYMYMYSGYEWCLLSGGGGGGGGA